MQIKELNARSRGIFKTIVETYLDSGDPVGSRTLSKQDTIDLSPASIRNVMADLEDAGLLAAPHTSAGRVPTDQGLRMFVDSMMELGNLTAEERASLKGHGQASGKTLEDLLRGASQALSGLTRCASVVMVPKQDLKIRQIEFVPLAPGRALAVLVSEQGTVENRLMEVPAGVSSSALIQAGNYITAKLSGRSIEDIQQTLEKEHAARKSDLDKLAAKVVDAGIAIWSGGELPTSLIVSGQANLLENLEAQEDLEKIRQLFDDLDRKSDLIELLDNARQGGGMRLFIGSENNLFSLTGSSVVVSPYMNGANEIIGVLGVIGPTRLNYARIIPMVDYTAQIVSRTL